jgi:hypothetical protein
MPNHVFKAGHYYAAAYNGDNGDLIVGRVRSVRTTGEVLLTNMITGKISTKSADVLGSRNKRITKTQAWELAEYAEHHSKAEVRKLAVSMLAFGERPAVPDSLPPPSDLEKALKSLLKISGHMIDVLKPIIEQLGEMQKMLVDFKEDLDVRRT